MPIEDKSCKNYAMLSRCSAGFTYAHIQNDFIGADPIVLAGAGLDGKDLEFAVPWEFLEENHLPGRFGFTCEDGQEVYRHVAGCDSEACREANKRLGMLSDILDREKRQLDGVMVAAQFNPKNGSERLVISKDNGWESFIEVLKPVFLWYVDGREDYVWPGEGRVRLEGGVHVSYGPDSDGVLFKNNGRERGEIEIPFGDIRKVRSGDKDIWRDTEIYHVEMSHENEGSFDRWGRVALELREDMEGVEELAQKVAEAKVGLSRVQRE